MYRVEGHFRAPGAPLSTGSPWERLSLYESRDMVEQRFQHRHGRRINDSKSRTIASHMIQGRQYFESAQGAGDLVRPLLLYYGVVAFSRALILFVDSGLRPSELRPGHGLSTVNWSSDLGEQKLAARNVPDLRMRVNEGTFSSLAKVTANDELVAVYEVATPPELWGMGGSPSTKVINWVAKGSTSYGDAAEFSIKDVLRRLPDLTTLCENSFNEHAHCFRADVTSLRRSLGHVKNSRASYLIDVFRGRVGLAPLGEIADTLCIPLDRLAVRPSQSAEVHHLELTDDAGIPASDILPPVRTDSNGNNYLMAPMGTSIPSVLSLLYLAAYFGGMLVRYHPATWQLMTSVQAGDRVLPLLRAATALVERRYPFEILERFERVLPLESMIEQPRLAQLPGVLNKE